MYVCMNVCMYGMCVRMHVCMYVCVWYVCTYVRMHGLYVRMYEHIQICTNVFQCVRLHARVCWCASLYAIMQLGSSVILFYYIYHDFILCDYLE